jgi:sodium transport system permease protein
MMRFSARLLVREDIVVPSTAETAAFLGGDDLLQKRALRWFAVMWAVVFVLAGNFSWFQNFRVQLLFNQLVVFLGTSLFMIAFYRVDLKRTLSLRSAPWPVWIAVPLAVPSGYVATVGLMTLANFVIPAPEEFLRQFSNQVIPDNVPMWQLFLLISILPAICEEVAFRGVLLHSLRKRFHPYVLCVVTGLIFGVFHYSLFRIAPSAFLGIILSWIVVMTGSILPGILLHAGNNAFALWLGSNDVSLEALEATHYAAACTVFVLTLWIIYRNRTRWEFGKAGHGEQTPAARR